MTDDIVTQLRRDRHNHIEDWWLLEDMCNEAADEIERLREACDYYHKMCSMIADKNFTANEDSERLRKEVRALEAEVSRLERIATNG